MKTTIFRPLQRELVNPNKKIFQMIFIISLARRKSTDTEEKKLFGTRYMYVCIFPSSIYILSLKTLENTGKVGLLMIITRTYLNSLASQKLNYNPPCLRTIS